jgi:putative flippase GtrA
MISGASPSPDGSPAEPEPTTGKASLVSRLLTGRVAGLLARNTVVSCAAFLFDLLLLWAFVEFLDMDKLVAAAIAFVIAVTLHYVFARSWIFKGTERKVASGYVYFLINAVVGLVLTILLFWAFMQLGLHYVIARVVASVFAGLTIFVLNAVLNFKSV